MEHKRPDQHAAPKAHEPRLAPGLDGVEGLDAEATPEEIAEENMTKVTKLKYDEYDPSES
ncbi:hypothetical protein [Alicyclobacillus acidoterrestris]|uniref:Uncharacterized protein n=1 Tax=Alicyclobacillus acidoterrestris (strain ATCC 49025 / DSM 3922 / CIP 106132 / NCIMB 13137 / GD3B) TaxID=1356854 RepID=T0D0A6_ALIAG|nr:hypothetical protein [Alicyclobacillus acidoterrestris]EPZ43226.1 hypothetical protein N007_13740 [Alicyclobacillus acidoterrestris ATCC 49025]UNO48538.1 hypothetical protein K1I37_18035 [Alicyclobacillus acidoterrestris]